MLMEVVMSKDISTCYTKVQNKKCGRLGYYLALREKVTIISPKDYGIFLQNKKNSKPKQLA